MSYPKTDSGVRARLSRRFRLTLVLLMAALGSLTCTPDMTAEILDGFLRTFGTTVTIPATDSTEPTVTFTVPTDSGNEVLGPSDAPLSRTMDWNDIIYVVAAAEDPEGVRSIEIIGEATLYCSNGPRD